MIWVLFMVSGFICSILRVCDCYKNIAHYQLPRVAGSDAYVHAARFAILWRLENMFKLIIYNSQPLPSNP